MSRKILHPVDDMLPGAVFRLARIDVDRQIVLRPFEVPIVTFRVPMAADEQNVPILFAAKKIRKDDLLQDVAIRVAQIGLEAEHTLDVAHEASNDSCSQTGLHVSGLCHECLSTNPARSRPSIASIR